jgi:hypothetical protein
VLTNIALTCSVLQFCLCCFLLFLQQLLLQLQFPDRANVLALMRRHPSWPGPGSSTPAAAVEQVGSAAAVVTAPDSPPAADTEDGDSDSDGGSDDAQDEMQDEVLPAAARLPRGRPPRKYNAQEQAVMRELKLNYLVNIGCRKTLSTGAMRWSVNLNAEGLAAKSRTLCGESIACTTGQGLCALI